MQPGKAVRQRLQNANTSIEWGELMDMSARRCQRENDELRLRFQIWKHHIYTIQRLAEQPPDLYAESRRPVRKGNKFDVITGPRGADALRRTIVVLA